MKKLLLTIITLAVFFPSLVFAHGISGGGFSAGLSHPVLGFDHLLAMLSVGILSAQMGGRAIWSVPLTFVIVMLFGGMLGLNGFSLMSVELGISISVLVLGLAVISDKKLSPIWVMVFVGFFAIFHGYAHGLEIPYLANPMYYVFGFIAGTTAIHIAGVMVGVAAKKIPKGALVMRCLGAGIAGIGCYFLVI